VRRAKDVSDTGSVQRIYRRNEMPSVTGYHIDHLYEMINAGEFPRPIPLGKRAVGWLERDVARWQAERIAKRDAEAA
jgi:prophage regulatory protein